MRAAVILFFLAINLIDLYLALFTATPQIVVVVVFFVSFVPYLWFIKRSRK